MYLMRNIKSTRGVWKVLGLFIVLNGIQKIGCKSKWEYIVTNIIYSTTWRTRWKLSFFEVATVFDDALFFREVWNVPQRTSSPEYRESNSWWRAWLPQRRWISSLLQRRKTWDERTIKTIGLGWRKLFLRSVMITVSRDAQGIIFIDYRATPRGKCQVWITFITFCRRNGQTNCTESCCNTIIPDLPRQEPRWPPFETKTGRSCLIHPTAPTSSQWLSFIRAIKENPSKEENQRR